MLILQKKPMHIRPLQPGDEPGLVEFSSKNKDFFYPSGLVRLPHDLTVEHWTEYITDWQKELAAGSAMRFLVFHENNDQIPIAKINYSQIFRGLFQACYLGYGMDEAYCGRGLMTLALRLTNAYMFNEQNIHRIMANYRPENKASAAVLAKLGFVVEGQAKDYLRINGVWRDHVLTSLTNPNWREV